MLIPARECQFSLSRPLTWDRYAWVTIDLVLAKNTISMKITKGLKEAAKAMVSPPKAQSFSAVGRLVECRHCENILFHKNKASLNTSASSIFGTEWLDREASVLICANCSRIEWFFDDLQPEKA